LTPTSPQPSYVFDSFALLAYLGDEVGADRVSAMLDDAEAGRCQLFMSAVNLGEVAYIVERERGEARAQEALEQITKLPVSIRDAAQELCLRAAHVKARLPIAYADCFAVALAQELAAAVVTGDPEFEKVERLVPIEWLPRT
jgi:predicted nucleic acid-binding protein